MSSDTPFDEIRDTMLANADKINKARWYPNNRGADKIWISGELGSDEISISYVSQGTRRNPENYGDGEWTLELDMVKEHGYHDIPFIPTDEMDDDVRDGLLYAMHENMQETEFGSVKRVRRAVTVW